MLCNYKHLPKGYARAMYVSDRFVDALTKAESQYVRPLASFIAGRLSNEKPWLEFPTPGSPTPVKDYFRIATGTELRVVVSMFNAFLVPVVAYGSPPEECSVPLHVGKFPSGILGSDLYGPTKYEEALTVSKQLASLVERAERGVSEQLANFIGDELLVERPWLYCQLENPTIEAYFARFGVSNLDDFMTMLIRVNRGDVAGMLEFFVKHPNEEPR